MKNRIYAISALTALGVMFTACATQAALSLEGQNGIFLNSLAYPIGQNQVELSSHYVNLSGLGTVGTHSVATGVGKNVELGYTRIGSSVSGVKSQDLLNAKWQFNKESSSAPAVAAWVQSRSVSGNGTSPDYGISATKLVKLGTHPTVLDLGVRSTKALGLGLFGFNNERKLKLEGSAAVFVTKKFAVGAEFKQQINGDAWKDIAFRYVASDSLNIDAGIADLGPGLRRQIALAATWKK